MRHQMPTFCPWKLAQGRRVTYASPNANFLTQVTSKCQFCVTKFRTSKRCTSKSCTSKRRTSKRPTSKSLTSKWCTSKTCTHPKVGHQKVGHQKEAHQKRCLLLSHPTLSKHPKESIFKRKMYKQNHTYIHLYCH